MTVSELIEELQSFDDDMEVQFAYNYGDYWRTTVCKDVTDIDTGYVEYSEYHRMNKLIDEDEDDDTDEDISTKKQVLILR
ncbi:hypothetical protein HDR61_01655 [bacterium]|nr:hypothetical protein [bacterium]